MKNNFSYLNKLILLISVATLLVISLFSHQIYQKYFTHQEEESQAFCGVSDVLYTNISNGKKLFKINCASCHNKNMKDDMTASALGNVEKRWADYPKEDFYNYIRNSTLMVDQKHPKAVELFEAWNGLAMPFFPDLTDDDIDAILEYVNVVYTSE